jgi:hypothetical protein
MKRFISIFTISFLMAFCSLVFSGRAQEKFEKESRIKATEVPKKALHFIATLELPVKVKWYLEEGLERQSIESKFKYQGARYSVEFDTLGNIEDVELEVKPKELPSAAMDAIAARLKEDCSAYKITKVQLQYLGEEEALKQVIRSAKVGEGVTTNVELVINCRNDQGKNLYEYLFDASGKVLSVSKIVFKNSSHLEY